MYGVICRIHGELWIVSGLCFGCEIQWRSKMPLREGKRVMTCPTCRQPERENRIEPYVYNIVYN